MGTGSDSSMLRALAEVAPGSPLRDGIDRVLQSGRGGLIIVGDGPDVLNICSGGFLLDAAYTPQRLSELAKMDGAIILAEDASRIARANVHLVPNPNVPTSETGTRHRTAERVARSLNVPVIAVSESRKEIQVYTGDSRHSIESVSRLLERSNQALQTLERYRIRLDSVTKELSTLELEDLVSLHHVIEVLQRSEMVVRIATEIEHNLVGLGTDGRLVRLQLDELMAGVADDRALLIRDYYHADASFQIEEAMSGLASLDDEALFDTTILAKTVRLPMTEDGAHMSSRGYRLLTHLPRVSETAVNNVVGHFGNLNAVVAASTSDLTEVEGIGVRKAKNIQDCIRRLIED